MSKTNLWMVVWNISGAIKHQLKYVFLNFMMESFKQIYSAAGKQIDWLFYLRLHNRLSFCFHYQMYWFCSDFLCPWETHWLPFFTGNPDYVQLQKLGKLYYCIWINNQEGVVIFLPSINLCIYDAYIRHWAFLFTDNVHANQEGSVLEAVPDCATKFSESFHIYMFSHLKKRKNLSASGKLAYQGGVLLSLSLMH